MVMKMKKSTSFTITLSLIFLSQFLLHTIACDASSLAHPSTQDYCQTQPQQPEQVHISLAGDGYMRVSYVTTYTMATSVVEYGTKSGKYNEFALGDNFNYHYYSYVSGKVHYVTIGPLASDTTYYYRCGGSGTEYSFRTPPSTYPLELAILGGIGQTSWSKATLSRINQKCHDVVLVAGGLSYADGQQSLWDSFGRFVEPYASRRPWMVVAGKQEIEGVCTISKGPQPFKAYNARWLMPYHESASTSNLYYSFDLAGTHIVMLGSYADFDCESAQYEWLKLDLTNIDRSKTPWVIVVVNTPWYTSSVAYKGEGESMRKALENLLYTARVDIVFASRVNAYERFNRTYDNKPDSCGPVYITLADGGFKSTFDFEQKALSTSLHKELSVGHGRLRIYDNKKAHWAWYPTEDDTDSAPSDQAWLTNLLASESKCLELCKCNKFHNNVKAHEEL